MSTELVSYPSSSHNTNTTHRISKTPPFVLLPPYSDAEEDPPSIFNIALPPCPNPKKRRVIDDITGEIDYLPYSWRDDDGEEQSNRCEKNSCPVCVVINAQRIAGAIKLADPVWWFSLTLVGDSAGPITKNVSSVISYARKEIPTLQAVWAAEENPKHTGVHIHGYFHAGRNDREIRNGILERAVQRAGIGDRWMIDAITNPQPGYFGYPMKSLAGEDYEVERFLDLNGSVKRRQLIHSSNGFWRDGRWGRQLKNREEAEQLAFSRSLGGRGHER